MRAKHSDVVLALAFAVAAAIDVALAASAADVVAAVYRGGAHGR